VLTDQVEAQGVKISDLETSLVEHQHKLNSTEEMLQQVHCFPDIADLNLILDFVVLDVLLDQCQETLTFARLLYQYFSSS